MQLVGRAGSRLRDQKKKPPDGGPDTETNGLDSAVEGRSRLSASKSERRRNTENKRSEAVLQFIGLSQLYCCPTTHMLIGLAARQRRLPVAVGPLLALA
jgi:hypothetical protein